MMPECVVFCCLCHLFAGIALRKSVGRWLLFIVLLSHLIILKVMSHTSLMWWVSFHNLGNTRENAAVCPWYNFMVYTMELHGSTISKERLYQHNHRWTMGFCKGGKQWSPRWLFTINGSQFKGGNWISFIWSESIDLAQWPSTSWHNELPWVLRLVGQVASQGHVLLAYWNLALFSDGNQTPVSMGWRGSEGFFCGGYERPLMDEKVDGICGLKVGSIHYKKAQQPHASDNDNPRTEYSCSMWTELALKLMWLWGLGKIVLEDHGLNIMGPHRKQ